MDFNATVDLIIRDLNDAREIIDDLKNYPGVPLIQVELAKSKCKSAGEVIALLKNLEGPVSLQEKKVVTRQEPEIPPVRVGESTIIADTFGLSDRINEKMGNLREDEDVSEILKSKPLTNLKEAIGINDKFLFIRELFGGNQEAYNQAITRIDNAESLEDAKAVIMSYRGENKETDAVRQLLDLVKRKFPPNE
jgi:hypothetical protein